MRCDLYPSLQPAATLANSIPARIRLRQLLTADGVIPMAFAASQWRLPWIRTISAARLLGCSRRRSSVAMAWNCAYVNASLLCRNAAVVLPFRLNPTRAGT